MILFILGGAFVAAVYWSALRLAQKAKGEDHEDRE